MLVPHHVQLGRLDEGGWVRARRAPAGPLLVGGGPNRLGEEHRGETVDAGGDLERVAVRSEFVQCAGQVLGRLLDDRCHAAHGLVANSLASGVERLQVERQEQPVHDPQGLVHGGSDWLYAVGVAGHGVVPVRAGCGLDGEIVPDTLDVRQACHCGIVAHELLLSSRVRGVAKTADIHSIIIPDNIRNVNMLMFNNPTSFS